MATSIGIDLGTTYCCLMYQREGTSEVQLIPSSEGEELTPSVVYFDPDGSVQVGKSAKRNLKSDPLNVVTGIKRHMGTEHPVDFHGRQLTPESVSALILQRLATDAADHLSVARQSLRAVVTVPAYFGAAEKEATHAAARLANLECLTLLPEPVSAAYAYGAEPTDLECSLVFDLGGGTFDVAVVGSVRGESRIWAIDGETQLGGLDWDARLVSILWEKLEKQLIDDSARFDDEFTSAVETEAEMVKRQLSIREMVIGRVRFAGTSYSIGISRAEFESACVDLVTQCVAAATRVIDAASGLGAEPVVRVLMVGGSTRMPMIRKALESRLGVSSIIHDPDRAVARGAAILAARLIKSPEISPGIRAPMRSTHEILRVLPRAIGIKIHSSQLPRRAAPYVLNVVPVNSPLPVRGATITVATIVPEQASARIGLYEQAGPVVTEDLEGNKLLFDGEILLPPKLPAGHPLMLSLSYDNDGRLDVHASDGRTRRPLEVVAFLNGVIDESEFVQQRSQLATLTVL